MSGFVPPLFGKPLSPQRNPRAVWRMSSVHSWNTWIRISRKSRLLPGKPVLDPLPWPGTRSWSHVFAILRLGQSSKHAIQNSPGIRKVNFRENLHKCRSMFCNQKNHKTSKSPWHSQSWKNSSRTERLRREWNNRLFLWHNTALLEILFNCLEITN